MDELKRSHRVEDLLAPCPHAPLLYRPQVLLIILPSRDASVALNLIP
eukprot:CAMPEP_0185754138 /NCGR_PEP_ID=MMETSP1174-20130828/12790_1 /TAXON_ID=35687 /ORGANISM="Dictyocha speculum, Strain CCMP1381" /LENGTH=46 /DNA_ID= /DNA_START= /DNA_END= /DNA_ORIENTATION=